MPPAVYDTASTASILRASYTYMQREGYFANFGESSFRQGRKESRMFRMSSETVPSSGITQQIDTGPLDGARISRDIMRDFQHSRAGTGLAVKYRLSQKPEENDFTEIQTVAQISDFDLANSGAPPEVARMLVNKVTKQFTEGYEEQKIRALLTPASGQLCVINGDIVDADSTEWASGTTFTANGTSARVKVDGGSIGLIQDNMHVDIYSSAGALLADECKVIPGSKNTDDDSFAITTTEFTTTGDLDALAASDDDAVVYVSGQRNAGMVTSFTEWFPGSLVAGAGDSFIEGRDRGASENFPLLPNQSRVSATASAVTYEMLADASQNVEMLIQDDQRTPVIYGYTKIINKLMRSAGDDVFKPVAYDQGEYNLGQISLSVQTPEWGKCNVMSSAMAPVDRIFMVNLADWKMLNAFGSGLRVMDGDGGSMWKRLPSADGQSNSKYFQAAGYTAVALACMAPKRQLAVFKVTG